MIKKPSIKELLAEDFKISREKWDDVLGDYMDVIKVCLEYKILFYDYKQRLIMIMGSYETENDVFNYLLRKKEKTKKRK